MALQHVSYPGFYGVRLNAETTRALTEIASAMIPGGEGYPSAAEAGVAEWIGERLAPGEREWLESLLGRGAGTDPHAWLTALEREEAVDFAALRGWVYKAYYSTPLVLGALRRRGSDYHGAPQPWGYAVDQYEQVPLVRRGRYIASGEARRVPLP